MTPERLGYLTRLAAFGPYAPRRLASEDRVSVARLALIEAGANGLTAERELLRHAQVRLTAAGRAELKAAGRHRDTATLHPAFYRLAMTRGEDFTEALLERVALVQVLAAVSAADRGTLQDRADGLGVNAHVLRRARQAAWALWYDTETPQRRVYGRKVRVSKPAGTPTPAC